MFDICWKLCRIWMSFNSIKNNSTPWDQQSLLGYFGDVCFIELFSHMYLFVNGAFLLLFISLCVHHREFYEIVRYLALQLDHADTQRNDKKLLCQLIRFHASAKEWVDLLSKVPNWRYFGFVSLVSSQIADFFWLQLTSTVRWLRFSWLLAWSQWHALFSIWI